MELLYLGCAFILTVLMVSYYLVPKTVDYVDAEIEGIKHQLDTLEQSLVQVKLILHKTQKKYESLHSELDSKNAALPKTLQTYSDDMLQNLEEKVKVFKEQMHKTHIDSIKQKQSQDVKTYILSAVHNKLSSQLKSKKVLHRRALQNIVLECKKSFQ